MIASSRVLSLSQLLVALASASVLALAQTPAGFSALALVALAPWVAVMRASSAAKALAFGSLSGTVYGMWVAPWLPEALRALGSSASTSLAGLVLTAAWAKAWMFGMTALVVSLVARRSRWLVVPVATLAMALAETVASGTAWGVPWALLGHSQLEVVGVAQLAVVGGVPLISALLMGTNVAIGLHRWQSTAALVSAWAGLVVVGLPLAEAVRPAPHGEPRDLLLVQPDLPRGERWGDDLQAANLTRIASFVSTLDLQRDPPDALIFPENLLTSPLDTRPALMRDFRRWVDHLAIPVVTGMALAAESDSTYRSAVVWFEPRQGIIDRLDKVRAVPVVESARTLPGQSILGALFGEAAAWPKVEEADRTAPGPLRGGLTVTPVLCYEALFPGLAAERRSPDSVAILNLADDGWVAGDVATQQLTAFASFRAIEQRLPLIRVAHGGLSVVVDAFGRRVEELPLDEYAIRRIEVRAQPVPSLREKATILAVPLGAGFVVWWLAGLLVRYRS
ncbi:MAG: apolipoprotein N-acyltransferase [Myxococcota bacterium]